MFIKSKRANNIIMGTKAEQLNKIRNDIVEFKTTKDLDQIIVLWTANTERFSEIITGVNDTADNLLKAIKEDHSEISPSTMFAVAAALERVRLNFDIIIFLFYNMEKCFSRLLFISKTVSCCDITIPKQQVTQSDSLKRISCK